MKIIGGIYKGTNLYTPKEIDIRPALARMKNSLFNILAGQIEGTRILDLFAGTGSLGFEALSRGAKDCLFVENNPLCFECLQKNISKLRLEKSTGVLLTDSFEIIPYLIKANEHFDYIFIAPPYKYYNETTTRDRLLKLIDDLAVKNVLASGGMVIVEHRLKQIKGDEFTNLTVIDTRNYGQTCLIFLKTIKKS